jgi:hypothetical protein
MDREHKAHGQAIKDMALNENSTDRPF